MSFNEQTLEKAVLELLAAEGIPHYAGGTIHKEISDVLLREDLKQFLVNQYSPEDITIPEVESIIRKLESYTSSALYASNKAIMQIIADSFIFKREDRTKKDLFINLLDFFGLDVNERKLLIDDLLFGEILLGRREIAGLVRA